MKRASLIILFVFVSFMIGFAQSGKAILADGNTIIFKRFNGILVKDSLKLDGTDFLIFFPTVFNGEVRKIQFDKLKSISLNKEGSVINVMAESKTGIQFSCTARIEKISLLTDDVLTNELIVKNIDVFEKQNMNTKLLITKIIFD